MTVLEQLHPQYVKNPADGVDQFVILPAAEFEELQNLVIIAERKSEPTLY